MQANICKRDGDGDGGGLSLPEDIVFDVLTRVPTKVLCRFRCVCKAWRALISDPSFFTAHRSRAGPLMVAMFGLTPERQEVRLLDMAGNVLRVFDIKGTALLAPTRLDFIFLDRMRLGAMIIDPASGQNFTVVGTSNPGPPPRAWWVNLSPTMTTAPSDYSFGRAAVSGSYKVLRLVTWSHQFGRKQWCEVATILDGGAEPTWRQRPWGPFSEINFSSEYNKATVNGVLYFMHYRTCSASYVTNYIAAFDLESEDWKPETIECPPWECKEKDIYHVALTELKGTLCVVHNIQKHIASLGPHYVKLWVLVDPNKSIWVKEYEIQMPARFFLRTKPLDVFGDGTILLLLNVTWEPNVGCRYILQFYNSSTGDIKDFMEMPDDFDGTMTFYTGSLLS